MRNLIVYVNARFHKLTLTVLIRQTGAGWSPFSVRLSREPVQPSSWPPTRLQPAYDTKTSPRHWPCFHAMADPEILKAGEGSVIGHIVTYRKCTEWTIHVSNGKGRLTETNSETVGGGHSHRPHFESATVSRFRKLLFHRAAVGLTKWVNNMCVITKAIKVSDNEKVNNCLYFEKR